MKPRVGQRATDLNNFLRPTIQFENARTAFKAFLQGMNFTPNDKILLPAYIGWSKKEGSGVFDPIKEVGLKFIFYRLTRDLVIDLDDLRKKILTGRPKLLVVIHYFGYPDPYYPEAVAYARSQGLLVVEDESHALFSDWVGGVCGRLGDAAVISLHKMFPFRSGGLLMLNNAIKETDRNRLQHSPLQRVLNEDLLGYDLLEISKIRRNHAKQLLKLLEPLRGAVDPLRSSLPDGVVPQTLPVVISGRPRNELYFELNKYGYGVVSLYHTLIEPIQQSEFPGSHWVAQRIMNLPVHQDVPADALQAMVGQLKRVLYRR